MSLLNLGLAELVTTYVAQLNNPGTIVNVKNSWERFVSTKCSLVKSVSTEKYDKKMALEINDKIPCDGEVIRKAHLTALDDALKVFREETHGMCAANVENCLKDIMVSSLTHIQN